MEINTTKEAKYDRIILSMNIVSFPKHYKIPLLIALVVSLAVITLGNETSPFGVVFTFLASIAGMFFVDLGAVLHAFIVDPSTNESQHLIEKIKLKDFKGVISFLNNEEYKVSDPTIKSALFQFLLLVFLYYAAIGGIPGFSKALIFSFFGSLLYFQMV